MTSGSGAVRRLQRLLDGLTRSVDLEPIDVRQSPYASFLDDRVLR